MNRAHAVDALATLCKKPNSGRSDSTFKKLGEMCHVVDYVPDPESFCATGKSIVNAKCIL